MPEVDFVGVLSKFNDPDANETRVSRIECGVRPTRMDVPSDRVIAAQSGDPGALADLLRAAWPHAYRMARTIVDDHATAEDVAQEACANALDALDRLRDPERFVPWFFRSSSMRHRVDFAPLAATGNSKSGSRRPSDCRPTNASMSGGPSSHSIALPAWRSCCDTTTT